LSAARVTWSLKAASSTVVLAEWKTATALVNVDALN
jgi:hypothetical protein